MQKLIDAMKIKKRTPDQELRIVDNTKDRFMFKTVFKPRETSNIPDPGLDSMWLSTKIA